MGYATDGQLPRDTNGAPAEGFYTPNVGTVAAQGGPVSTDQQGTNYASQVISLNSTTAIPAPADSVAFAGVMPSVNMMQTGTGVASPRRTVTKFVQLQAQAITHATPVDVYTPATGKKWRILSYHLSDTVAGAIQFEDTTGVEFLRTPLLLASTPTGSPEMGNGYLSSAANNHLFLDVTVTGNVSGWIGIEEE